MLHGYETVDHPPQKKKSLSDTVWESFRVWGFLIPFGIMVGVLIYTSIVKAPEEAVKQSPVVQIPLHTEGLLRTSISNIQKQGKLVITTMDLQAINTSEKDGAIVGKTSITTASWAKVQFSMDMRKFDANWISVKNNEVLVTLPSDFIQTEIMAIGSKDIDNSSWWSTDAEKKILIQKNNDVNQAQMLTQANSLLDVTRPAAAQELRNLFNIPVKAVSPNLSVRVIIN